MSSQQLVLLAINIIGGVLVIGSYVYGIKSQSQAASGLWGGISPGMKNLYFVSMFFAAVSYFVFTFYILFKLNPAETKIANIFGFGLFQIIYIFMLLPSAAWMPLSVSMLENPKSVVWYSIRVVLAIVALASLALLFALVFISPKQTSLFYFSAVAGSAVFFVHTAFLDALLWPVLFQAK